MESGFYLGLVEDFCVNEFPGIDPIFEITFLDGPVGFILILQGLSMQISVQQDRVGALQGCPGMVMHEDGQVVSEGAAELAGGEGGCRAVI